MSDPFSPYFSAAKDVACKSNIALEAICIYILAFHVAASFPAFLRSWATLPLFSLTVPAGRSVHYMTLFDNNALG